MRKSVPAPLLWWRLGDVEIILGWCRLPAQEPVEQRPDEQEKYVETRRVVARAIDTQTVIVKFPSLDQSGDRRWLSLEQPLVWEVRVLQQAHFEWADETVWLGLGSQDTERIQEDFLVGNVVDGFFWFWNFGMLKKWVMKIVGVVEIQDERDGDLRLVDPYAEKNADRETTPR
jgi:hypothetical protein